MSLLTTRDVAFRLVQIEADVLHAKAAAVLYEEPGKTAEHNAILHARLIGLRTRVNALCEEILTGDETKLFLAD